MNKKSSSYRTIRTPEGTVFHLFEHQPNRWTPHSNSGPAILYSKSQKKQDEYYVYGIKYSYDRWLELSRIPKRSQSESGDFIE